MGIKVIDNAIVFTYNAREPKELLGIVDTSKFSNRTASEILTTMMERWNKLKIHKPKEN